MDFPESVENDQQIRKKIEKLNRNLKSLIITLLEDGYVVSQEEKLTKRYIHPDAILIQNQIDELENSIQALPSPTADFNFGWLENSISKSKLNLYQPHGFYRNAHETDQAFEKWFINDEALNSYRGTEPVSCHDVMPNSFAGINSSLSDHRDKLDKLIILGVGPVALEPNLSQINLNDVKNINTIYYTCHIGKDGKDHNHKYVDYFEKRFGSDMPLKRFYDCTELAKALAQEFGEA